VGYPELGPILTEFSKSYLALSLVSSNPTGTVLTSTRSILYGNVTARMKTPSVAGVVVGFALISGTGDEVDVE
jgi:beta-glucanase (GH16 family)